MSNFDDTDYLTEGLTKDALVADFEGEIPSIWSKTEASDGMFLERSDDPFAALRDKVEDHMAEGCEIQQMLSDQGNGIADIQDMLSMTAKTAAKKGDTCPTCKQGTLDPDVMQGSQIPGAPLKCSACGATFDPDEPIESRRKKAMDEYAGRNTLMHSVDYQEEAETALDDLGEQIRQHARDGENLRAEVGDMAEDTSKLIETFRGNDVSASFGGTHHDRLKRLAEAEKGSDKVYSNELRVIDVKKGDKVQTPNGAGEVDDVWDDGRTCQVRLPSGELRPYRTNRLQKVEALHKQADPQMDGTEVEFGDSSLVGQKGTWGNDDAPVEVIEYDHDSKQLFVKIDPQSDNELAGDMFWVGRDEVKGLSRHANQDPYASGDFLQAIKTAGPNQPFDTVPKEALGNPTLRSEMQPSQGLVWLFYDEQQGKTRMFGKQHEFVAPAAAIRGELSKIDRLLNGGAPPDYKYVKWDVENGLKNINADWPLLADSERQALQGQFDEVNALVTSKGYDSGIAHDQKAYGPQRGLSDLMDDIDSLSADEQLQMLQSDRLPESNQKKPNAPKKVINRKKTADFRNGDIVTVKIQYGKRGTILGPDAYGNFVVAWENGQQQHVNPELLERIAHLEATAFRKKLAEEAESALPIEDDTDTDDEGGAIGDLEQLNGDDDLAAGLSDTGPTVIVVADAEELGDILDELDLFEDDLTSGDAAAIDAGMSGEDFTQDEEATA